MRDLDVRLAVRGWLRTLHAGDDGTRVVEEMGIWAGTVRVDIAVINGELHGIELKSARDTLDRLPLQALIYSQVFDRITLVVADKHVRKAETLIPEWWGISVATECNINNIILSSYRLAHLNESVSSIQIARLLWREEALALLCKFDLIKGYKSKNAETLAQRLADNISLSQLSTEVRTFLKYRDGWLGKLGTD